MSEYDTHERLYVPPPGGEIALRMQWRRDVHGWWCTPCGRYAARPVARGYYVPLRHDGVGWVELAEPCARSEAMDECASHAWLSRPPDAPPNATEGT